MTEPVTLTAGDLVLRPWRPDDRPPFAALNADPEVMRYFPRTLSQKESDAMVDRIEAFMAREGWGLWALDAPGLGFVGFVGLAQPNFTAWFTSPEKPAVEVGWRLAQVGWGKGWASAAAMTALRYALTDLGLDDVVSFTSTTNEPSRRVMEKLGLTHEGSGDFDHPMVIDDDRLRRHVLYRIDAATFAAHEADPGLRRLAQHVGAFNAGVRTGEWGALLRGCTDDVSLSVAGGPEPAVRGWAVVEAAYRADPPPGEIAVAGAHRDGDEVVAGWGMIAAPFERAGELRLLLRQDRVARIAVSVDR